jgi:hypothetical protein
MVNTQKITKRFYSSKSDTLPIVTPTPVFILKNLSDKAYIDSQREVLKNKAGIYSFINTINGKQYIGSAKDFYIRLNEHLNNKKSNTSLQTAFNKYGLDNFN